MQNGQSSLNSKNENSMNCVKDIWNQCVSWKARKKKKRLGGAGYTIASLFDDDGDGSEEEVGSDGEVVQSLLPFQFLEAGAEDDPESSPNSLQMQPNLVIHPNDPLTMTPSATYGAEEMQVEILELRKINEELGHQVEQLTEHVQHDKAALINKLEQQTQELARLRKSGEELTVEREKRKLFEWELKMKNEQIEKFYKSEHHILQARLKEVDLLPNKSEYSKNFEEDSKELEGLRQCKKEDLVQKICQLKQQLKSALMLPIHPITHRRSRSRSVVLDSSTSPKTKLTHDTDLKMKPEALS